MNDRRKRRLRIRILGGDMVMVALLIAAAAAACAYWPQKAVAAIAIPMAALVAFVSWRMS
jgi:fatty acid desaturase